VNVKPPEVKGAFSLVISGTLIQWELPERKRGTFQRKWWGRGWEEHEYYLALDSLPSSLA
jgi:hypothetical protein